jgi:hypothetical protein
VQDKMRWAEDATARNTGTTLTLALNYGGRSELVDAFRGLAAEMKLKHISPDRITEEDIHRHLYTAHMPDPDLLIRTSGEMRISNYLLWQIAYTEIFVTERLWPDFRGIHLLEAIADFQRRERRYGGSAKAAAKWKKRPTGSRSPPADLGSVLLLVFLWPSWPYLFTLGCCWGGRAGRLGVSRLGGAARGQAAARCRAGGHFCAVCRQF